MTMRIALISDIHGKLVALDAVLADIARHGVDRIVCLGDLAMSGPWPREVVARVRVLGCPVVKGNCDDLVVGMRASGHLPSAADSLDDLARTAAGRALAARAAARAAAVRADVLARIRRAGRRFVAWVHALARAVQPSGDSQLAPWRMVIHM